MMMAMMTMMMMMMMMMMIMAAFYYLSSLFLSIAIGHLHDGDILLLQPESFRVLLSCAN